MKISLCLLEITKISKAFKIINDLTLKYPVKIFLNRKICPGHYLCLLEGSENDIFECGEYVSDIKDINYRIVNSLSQEVVEVIKKKKPFEKNVSVGIFEFSKSIDAIKYSDLAIKKLGIIINKIDFSLGMFGKGVIFCSGTNAELIDFKNYLLKEVPPKNIVALEVITGPSQELMELL